MTQNNNKVSAKILIAAVGLALGAASAMAAIMSSVYCTKTEVAAIKEEVKERVADNKLKAAQVEWEVKSISVRMENIEKRQIQMGENITKVLTRLRVEPVDPPYLRPVPRMPPGMEIP